MTFKKLSRNQLERHIRQTARDRASVIISPHAYTRMRQRGVMGREIFECLLHGRIDRPPEEDLKTGCLVCRMTWYGPSCNLAVCVGLVDDNPKLLVITVIA